MGLETGLRPPSRVGAATFGRYEAIAKIGEGGMGQVFLARARGEAGFQRLFALKVIGARGEAATLMRTLLNEAKMAARVQHRNVVGILDVGSYDDGHYLVMEYVEGCTLSELQRRRRDARPPRLVLPIIIDALFGLHAAHAVTDESGAPLHLIHSDITPQNLLIGLDGACRVTDFGIARVRDLASGTRPDRVKGTPGYMSPEQVMGDPLDLRSDIFSAGVVLWNALTGKKLFHGATDHASTFHVLKRSIPKPSTVGLRPLPELDGLVMKALERDRTRRFQTAEEMATALRDAAMRAGQLASPSAVAEWVTSTFSGDLEARRRTIREVGEHHKVARIDGDRPSLAAISTVLPRFETLNTSDVADHLSLEDLSLESDEMDLGEQLLSSDEAGRSAGTPVPGTAPPERRSRALPIALGFGGAAIILVVVLWWLKSQVGEKVATPPAPSVPVAAAPAPAPAAPAPTAAPTPVPVPVAPAAAAAPPVVAPKPAAPPPPSPPPPTPAPPPEEPVVTVEEQAPAHRGTRPHARTRPAVTPVAPPPASATARPATEPPPKPESPPKPEPDKNRPELESNPYLYK